MLICNNGNGINVKGESSEMKDGYVRVSCATPNVKVADCEYNSDRIIECIDEAIQNRVKILVLPELCITGYTCGDLFLQRPLLEEAKRQLIRITKATLGFDTVVSVGFPFVYKHKVYNCGAFLQGGKILGIVPKTNLPNYSEFYEARYFEPGPTMVQFVQIDDMSIPFGTNLLFQCQEIDDLVIGCEICEDLWVPHPPSTSHALAGATVICNLSASDETTTKENYRKSLIGGQSARLVCAYLYADAGNGESTTDVVYSSHNVISENGAILAEAERFKNQSIYADIDLYRVTSERRRLSTYKSNADQYYTVLFSIKMEALELIRSYSKSPFIPQDYEERKRRCDEILMIQAMGLKKRLEHTNCRTAVLGISGGLDSTLAALVIAKAFDQLSLDRSNILCVTMPCFGTTKRTYTNAIEITQALGATLREINIKDAVEQHFKDIGHDPKQHDITYENAQARERTKILMDIANQTNGLVIGTGDMSELALGWATYNGDHMSMYAVNASVPKTLVRHLVQYYADTTDNQSLKKSLIDVLDTPVSPELLPPVDGKISQKTEDLVGPYELHDFYLYYMLRFGFSPAKIYRIAVQTFEGEYDPQTIYKWLRTFYWRFFSQQFKRSCVPDGPKVGSVALSPRGDLKMPSDASANLWMKELDQINLEL